MPVKPPPSLKAKEIDEFINKGGKVSSDDKQAEEWTMISVRLPKSLLKQIDEKRASSLLTRNTWILGLFLKEVS